MATLARSSLLPLLVPFLFNLANAALLNEDVSLFLSIRSPTPVPKGGGGKGGSSGSKSGSKSKGKKILGVGTVGLIVIIAVAILILIATIFVIWCCLRRRRARKSKGQFKGITDDDLVGHDMRDLKGDPPAANHSFGMQGRQFGGAYEPMKAPQETGVTDTGYYGGQHQPYGAPPPQQQRY